MREVDRVLGNHAKLAAETWIEAKRALDFGIGDEEKIRIDDLDSVRETALHLVDGFDGHVRAFVQVQNGCDHRCTFCIIPYGRGPSRSVPMGEIVEQVRRLVETEYREVVLTGVDLTAWGLDLPGGRASARSCARSCVMSRNCRACAFPRSIRWKSTRPPARHRRGRTAHAASASVASAWRRSHAQAHEAPPFARRRNPILQRSAPPAPGYRIRRRSDRGLPDRKRNHFRNSLALADDCGLTFLHVFPFSPRKGTPAARMPQLARTIVKERAARCGQGRADVAPALRVGNRPPPPRAGGRRRHGRPQRTFRPRGARRRAPRGTILDVTISGHDGKRLLAA
jgi:threonylcarbamoyladenosine tRNA methylthiotransferase MtaB